MDWQLALIQHPMFLLIKEDTGCAERTPPWGEPSLEHYIERVRKNMQTLRSYPQIKIGFEWSGLEVEMLAQEAPDVFAEMCALAKEGQVSFYNGTYAQPHLQILSPEANIRQFEFGMRVYHDLCQASVGVYAHQETSVHDQSPQIMRAFGMKYSVLPQFPSSVGWLDGGEIVTRLQQVHFMQGQEFVRWVGLDGSEIPLYLTPALGTLGDWGKNGFNDWVADQQMYGLMQEPPIMVEIPDLVDVDDSWLAKRSRGRMVLLDEALPVRIEQAPAQGRVRHYTYWSYIEGIRAEELSRNNWIAEYSALRAEALNALAQVLVKRPAQSTDAIWKSILTTQHHDVYCFCGPELRGKSIDWLAQAAFDAQRMSADAAQTVTARIDTTAQEGTPLVAFNTLPHEQRALVTFDAPAGSAQVVNAQGEVLPARFSPAMDGSQRVTMLAPASGFGYETYWLRAGSPLSEPPIDLKRAFTFENSFYRAVVQPDGTFTSLVVKLNQTELLSAPGNRLAALDSTGISPTGNLGLRNRPDWQPPEGGTELTWQPTASARLERTPLGVTITAPGQMAANVKATLTINFYHDLQRIDLSYDFDFDTASLGVFYLNETKLRVLWPLAVEGKIYQDIPFGVIETHTNRPILPNSWLDITDGEAGLGYFHQGTFKHWVKDGTLVNLFAWGEETNAIGSRMWRENWSKCFDQRLQGKHTIKTALLPHTGDWRAAEIVPAAYSYNQPPVAYAAERHTGTLPASLNLLQITSPDIRATSIQAKGDELVCRVYSYAQEPVALDNKTERLHEAARQALNGEAIRDLKPFMIGTVTFDPN